MPNIGAGALSVILIRAWRLLVLAPVFYLVNGHLKSNVGYPKGVLRLAARKIITPAAKLVR